VYPRWSPADPALPGSVAGPASDTGAWIDRWIADGREMLPAVGGDAEANRLRRLARAYFSLTT